MNSSTAQPSYTRSCSRSSRFSRSLTLSICETTAASARSGSPDNTHSARARELVLDALKLRIRLVLSWRPWRRPSGGRLHAPGRGGGANSRSWFPRYPCSAPRLALLRGKPSQATTPSPFIARRGRPGPLGANTRSFVCMFPRVSIPRASVNKQEENRSSQAVPRSYLK